MFGKGTEVKEKAINKGREIMENETIKKFSKNPLVKKFLKTPKLYLNIIDNGHLFKNPFKILYGFLAIINIIIPIYIMIKVIDIGIFNAPFKIVIAFILIWFIIVIASFFGFHIWWNRKNKVESLSKENDAFVAIPVFSHFIQTLGEYVGTYIALVGSLGSLFMALFLNSEDSQQLANAIGLDLFSFGIGGVVIMLIIGFLIIIISRFFAEQFKALATIANNTKK